MPQCSDKDKIKDFSIKKNALKSADKRNWGYWQDGKAVVSGSDDALGSVYVVMSTECN